MQKREDDSMVKQGGLICSIERGIKEMAAGNICRCKGSLPKDKKGGKSHGEGL